MKSKSEERGSCCREGGNTILKERVRKRGETIKITGLSDPTALERKRKVFPLRSYRGERKKEEKETIRKITGRTWVVRTRVSPFIN